MQVQIRHEVPGRMRVTLAGSVPRGDVDALRALVAEGEGVTDVVVYPRTGSIAVSYEPGCRASVLAVLSGIDAQAVAERRAGGVIVSIARTDDLVVQVADLVGAHLVRRLLLPAPFRAIGAVWRYRRFLAEALRSLAARRLDVPVLDATAIGVSILRGNFKTASSTMLLLGLGELFEGYAREQSRGRLVASLLETPEYASKLLSSGPDGEEVAVCVDELDPGDVIVARTGMSIPVDGVVECGVAMVNQAALTGEPLAVERTAGDDVFAGTAVEDGEIVIRVRAAGGGTKLRAIANLVERSESLKAEALIRRESLADKIVPWNLALALAVGALTRDPVRFSAALMVDYSCALKLTSAIAVLTALNQAAREGAMVKGSKHFEALAQADTIVFDKTGTLTEATPSVARVLAFDGWGEDEVLRLSACLEEHFPHPIARAVVGEASRRGLEHRERHAEVEYLVAHGISSSIDGMRAVIGSGHFVTEDESVEITAEQRGLVESELGGLSPLYLAVDGRLKGVIGVEDPLKPASAAAVAELRELGFEHIVMLTGDGERAAARIAEASGIDEWESDLLPEDKHAYIQGLVDRGRTVVMVGDGVNDSPALSAASVGVSMASGTAIAREVADIVLSTGDLAALVDLRRLSMGLEVRMDRLFREVISLNSVLLFGGIGGAITPQASSLVHNASTVFFSMRSSRAYR